MLYRLVVPSSVSLSKLTSPVVTSLLLTSSSRCYKIDKSLLPTLNEKDLEEKFIKGSGPGGQAINTTSSCVMLKHKPTGIVVKVQDSRLLQQNQVLARENLRLKLDDHYNGEQSVRCQMEREERRES